MDIFDVMYDNFKFDKDKPIKLFEAFSGYGSQYMALKRLGVKVDVVGYSEIDKFAIQVYEALHGKHKNYGGIGSFDRLPKDIDICTWSFPCQDISLAGKQRGMEDGSRSNYGYVFLDTVEATPYHERPKVLLMENVRALFSEKFRDDWREIQLRLERLGYTNYADILNAKDYGVAQNRERVFIVSILGEYNYTFPKPIPLTKRLKDYLEDEVDEKYYLNDRFIEQMTKDVKNYNRKDKFIGGVSDGDIVARTITTKLDRPESNYIAIPEATKQGYAEAHDGDGVYINRPHQKRGVVQKGMIQTLKTSGADVGVVVKDKPYSDKSMEKIINNIVDIEGASNTITANPQRATIDSATLFRTGENLRIRKLTPREALRLMDVSESDIDIILSEVSNTQAYKLAGNSIVVSVLVEIFRNLF